MFLSLLYYQTRNLFPTGLYAPKVNWNKFDQFPMPCAKTKLLKSYSEFFKHFKNKRHRTETIKEISCVSTRLNLFVVALYMFLNVLVLFLWHKDLLFRYMMDQREKTLTKKFTRRRVCCVLVLVFQLAPILRYFDALKYALKSRKAEKAKDVENQRKYYELMIKEDSDVALLRVLECFLEAAPQQILQITIIFYTHGQGIGGFTCKWNKILLYNGKLLV